MFKTLFTAKLRTELAEIKHQHQLEIQEMKAEIAREKKHWEEDKKRTEKQLKDEHEIKLKEVLTLTKLDSEQRIKKAELDAESKHNQRVEKLNKEYYDKLSESMTKLHEQGNVSTQFTRDLALKMIEGMPRNNAETKVKVLTGTTTEDAK